MTTFETPLDEKSAKVLAAATKALGDTEAVRQIVHNVYAFGRMDGNIEANANADAKMRKILAGVTP